MCDKVHEIDHGRFCLDHMTEKTIQISRTEHVPFPGTEHMY